MKPSYCCVGFWPWHNPTSCCTCILYHDCAACLPACRDRHELVRRQALALLANLLMKDYVKWRGALFHRCGRVKLPFHLQLTHSLTDKWPIFNCSNGPVSIMQRPKPHPIRDTSST
jgi:hypothetical protein